MIRRIVQSHAARVGMAALLAAGAMAPHASCATPAAPEKPVAVDVTLQPGRLLVGQLVDASGAPRAKQKVQITLADGSKAEVATNSDGGFAFRGVRGVARLESENADALVRGWSPGTAPPSATPALLLVEQGDVARGQHYPSTATQGFVNRSKMLMANPLFVAGVVGTAVAIPVAIHNSDDDDPVSP